jgi:hypothetical protein
MAAATTTMFARTTIKMTTIFATKADAVSVKIVVAIMVAVGTTILSCCRR